MVRGLSPGMLDALRRASRAPTPGGLSSLGLVPCISLCGMAISGANADYRRFQNDLARAGMIFQQCGIQVVEQSFRVVDHAAFQNHPDWNCERELAPSAMRMFNTLGPLCPRGHVLTIYVRSLGFNFIGCGLPDIGGGQAALVVSDAAGRNTFPHEIGHTILGGGHSTDPTNLMYRPSGLITVEPPRLTAAQCRMISASSLVHQCGPIPAPPPVAGPIFSPVPAVGGSPVRAGLLAAEEGDLAPVVRMGHAGVPELIGLLSGDTDPAVRSRAGGALAQIGGDKAARALAIAAQTDAHPVVRLTAGHALGLVAGPAAHPVLAGLLQDQDAGVRITGLHALARLQTPEARAAIAEAAQREANTHVRAIAEGYSQGSNR